nr:hypothetical protein [uncultured Pseudomonas sp.]
MSKKILLSASIALILITAAGGFPWLLEHVMQLVTGCPDYRLICQ